MIKKKTHLQEKHMTLTRSLNIIQCPPNHMTYASAKFEVATSNSLREDAFTRKYIMTFVLDLGVKVTSKRCSVWTIHLQGLSLIRRTVKEEMHLQEKHYSHFDLGHGASFY